MRKFLIKFMLISFWLVPLDAFASQVSIYDEMKKDYIMAEKMDCRVHKTKSGITLGLKGGNFLFSFGPEITIGGEAKVKWEEAVQGLVVRYEELCSRFNTGILSKQEYEKKIEEISEISKEAFDFQEKKLKRSRDKAKSAFDELEKEAGRFDDRKEIENKVDMVLAKVQSIPEDKRKGGQAPIEDGNEPAIDLVLDNKNGAMNKAGIRPVIFSHSTHKPQFKCNVCHDGLFAAKKGANDIDMKAIMRGEFCGKCHDGKMSWESLYCDRCHSYVGNSK